ncbi:MAG: ribosome assembly factor SBDS [Nanoarchaeota archaeon]
MVQTTARIKKNAKHFEILVDLDEALKFKKSGGNINSVVLTDFVFYNLKSGEQASAEDLKKAFATDDFDEVCEKIIKQGEIELPSEYLKKEQEQRYKQVVDFLSKNAVDKNSRPYTPNRIMQALEEAHVNLKNKPIESQIPEIIEQLSKIIPIKVEIKKVRITIPAQYTGKAYGLVHEYLEKEDWMGNGDLDVVVKIPAGLILDFYDKLNSITHGSAISEELKS